MSALHSLLTSTRALAGRGVSYRRCLLAFAVLGWTTAACSPELLDPTLDRIEVSPDSVVLEVGQAASLAAQAFDENGTNVTNAGGTANFEWISTHGAYVEVDPAGQSVTVSGLQEWVDGGVPGWNRIEVRIQGRAQPLGRAYVQVSPVHNIQVSPSPIELQVGETVTVVAEATISSGTNVTVPTTWSIGDLAVAALSGVPESNTASVTALVPGVTTLTATMGTQVSNAVTVTVTDVPATFTRTEFVWVEVPVEIDFDLQGNLFVGSNAVDAVRIQKVTPDGSPSDFGDPVLDPDALIVDKAGVFSALGPGTVLVSGAYDSQFTNNHITEIKADGSDTRVLLESAPPLLSNPSSFAFLSNGDLLVGNYSNSTVSVLRNDGSGGLSLEAFYADGTAPNGLNSIVSVDGSVYVRSGSGALVELDESGSELNGDLWPMAEPGDPVALAVDVFGSLGGDLLVAGSDGRIRRMDRASRGWALVGDITFAEPIFGIAVSPVDGALYVAERSGQIWKVTKD